MREGFSPREYQIHRGHITLEEMQAVSTVASLRRTEASFRSCIENVEPQQQERLRHIASADHAPAFLQKETTPQARQLEAYRLQHLAAQEQESDPANACFRLACAARIAMHGQSDAMPYVLAARPLALSLGDGTSALRARAMLLSVEHLLARTAELPDTAAVAQEVQSGHAGVLRDYALALPQAQREEFLSHFPARKGDHGLSRAEVSAILDRLLAEVYAHGAAGDDEHQEIMNIRERSSEAARDAITNPTEADVRRMMTMLAHTIAELPGEESKHLLRDLSEASRAKVAGDKSATQERMKMGVAVAREAYAADQKNGSMIMKKMLGNPDVPQSVWTEFVTALMASGEVSKHLSRFVPKDETTVRRLFAQYPNEVNTIADTLADTRFADVDLTRDSVTVFGALKDLETVTPIIFDRYRRSDEQGRKELSEKIRQLKPAFFRNQPIGNILDRKDADILTEMVYAAYRPVGMSFEQVQRFLEEVPDCTEHVQQYSFPQDGYLLSFDTKRKYRLKEGHKIDQNTATLIRTIFADRPKQIYADRHAVTRADESASVPTQTDKEVNPQEAYVWALRDLLLRFAKGGTECSSDELQTVLSLFHTDDMVQRFVKQYPRVTEQNGQPFFTEAKELLGLYFRDNFPKRLDNFLSAQPKVAERVIKELQKPDRIAVIRQKMKSELSEHDLSVSDVASAARLLSKFIEAKVLRQLQTKVEQGANAFEPIAGSGSGKMGGVRAYVSKNAASFFAKAAAGICTSEDASLFEREDHFHINIVEDNARVVGNIQAYIIDEAGGKQSLVLRGFNPTTEVLKRLEADQFVEEVLRSARQFVADNHLTGLYITEGLGGWHALSNREQVNKYILPKYCKEKNARPYRLSITGHGQTVNTLYVVR